MAIQKNTFKELESSSNNKYYDIFNSMYQKIKVQILTCKIELFHSNNHVQLYILNSMDLFLKRNTY